MRIGIALIAAGLVIIALSLVEALVMLRVMPNISWWTLPIQFSHQHYFVLFGIGFLLIGIKLSRKKKD